MLTTGEATIITLSVLQIVAVGIGLAILHPQLNGASVGCIGLLLAGGITMFREVRSLRRLVAEDEKRCAMRTESTPASSAADSPEPQPAKVVVIAPAIGNERGNQLGHERRVAAIEVGFGDSPAQIAKMMVTSSFRQASMKYHPDHGGSNELMGRIVEARELLLTAFKRY